MPAGAKGKYNPEVVKCILKNIQTGSTKTQAAILANIDITTLGRWEKKFADFAVSMKKAEAVFRQSMEKTVTNAAPKNWTAAAWMLERRYPAEYGIKVKQEHTGKNEGPIEMNHKIELKEEDLELLTHEEILELKEIVGRGRQRATGQVRNQG